MSEGRSHDDRSTSPGPIDLCGIELADPLINASGTFDVLAARRAFGDAAFEEFPFSAYVSKTITPLARPGNPPPRIWEEPAAMVNSIGLPNKGVEGFLAHDLPELAELPAPLIVSVMATSAEHFADAVRAISGSDRVDGVELNVSCPNVHSGLIVGEQPSETEHLLETLRPITDKPLIVKLTPNVADPSVIAVAAEQGGADAVSLINTLKAAPLMPDGSAWLGAGSGGLSGPAVRTVALKQVADVVAAVDVPVIGMGGVEHGDHAAALIGAGATAVAVGTANFRDPLAVERIRSELSNA